MSVALAEPAPSDIALHNFDAASSQPQPVVDALRRSGVVRLAGAVDRALTAELRRLHAQAAAAVEGMDFSQADAYTQRRRLARHEFLLSELNAQLPAATIGALHPLIGAAAALYMGASPTAHPVISIRTVHPDRAGSGLVFHQDSGILNVACLNVWFPLHALDETMPGLELALGSHGAVLKTPTPGQPSTTDALEIPEDEVVARWGQDSLIAPRLQDGDALLFDGACVHRSQPSDGCTAPRSSVEIRLIAKPT
ncbi:MAG: phytanoyl-CoA dioxygenase family protein [Pseudomonadota bacterium]